MYKTRLVTQGFSQVPRVDYGATLAPVIKPVSVCLLVALVAQLDWKLDTFDVKCAFLCGILMEKICMQQPKGFEDGDWHEIVWLMLHTIYGLKQAALEWYEQVCTVMSNLGFTHVCYGRGGSYFIFSFFPCRLYTSLSFILQ